MGDDYDHNQENFDDGDPNIKPRKPPAPKWNGKGHADKIIVKFPEQKQWLTRMMVQV